MAGGAAAAAGMGMGVAAMAKVPLIAPSVASHSLDGKFRPLLLLASSNLGSTTSRMQCLSPTTLYRKNFTLSIPSGLQQLGLSILQGSALQGSARQGVVCGAARGMAGSDLESWVKMTNATEPVVVYSKSWCPYCLRVKKLFGKLGYDFEVVELDESDDESGLQDALTNLTGQYTVPNVFIGGKHIGGCDDMVMLHSRGKLEPLLQAAGANRI